MKGAQQATGAHLHHAVYLQHWRHPLIWIHRLIVLQIQNLSCATPMVPVKAGSGQHSIGSCDIVDVDVLGFMPEWQIVHCTSYWFKSAAFSLRRLWYTWKNTILYIWQAELVPWVWSVLFSTCLKDGALKGERT